MPKFSIIVPVYNTAQYVEECIKSIVSQTNCDYELIVIDDGSNDRSVEIVKNIIKDCAHCRIIQSDHRGVCSARNKGIEIAKGDYICFVDSDDILYADYIENLFKAIEIYNNPDVIYFYITYGTQASRNRPEVSTTYTRLTKTDIRYLSAAALYHTPEVDSINGKYHGISSFSACMQVYKRELYIDNDVRYTCGIKRSEDGLLNLEILNYAYSGVIIERALYIYRTDNISATRSYIPDLASTFELRDACVIEVINRLYDSQKSEYIEKYLSSLIYQLRVTAENQIFNKHNPKDKHGKMQEFMSLLSRTDYNLAVNTCGAYYLAPEDKAFLEILQTKRYGKIPRIIARKQLEAYVRRTIKRYVCPSRRKQSKK